MLGVWKKSLVCWIKLQTETLPTWTYGYNAAGDLGTDGEDSYVTDALGRLTEAWVRNPFGQDQHQLLAYDAFGNRTSTMTQAVTGWPAGQQAIPAAPGQSATSVSTVQNAEFRPAYIPRGQTRPELASFAAANQVPAKTAAGSLTGALYDLQGNLTRLYGTIANAATQLTLQYDALARVTRLGDSKNATAQTYSYDDEGLRSKIVDAKTGVITYDIYNEARQLIAQYEKTPTGALAWKKDIVYVGVKEVAEIDRTGKTWVTLTDHLGSPRFTWNGTAPAGGKPDGVNLIQQKYLPFGEALGGPTDTAKFAKGFTNHEQTDPSGLIYM